MSDYHFYSACGERPVRLSEATRRFADESLHHKYGLEMRKTMCVTLDDIANWDELEPLEHYNLAIRRICEEAPLRICDGERISGAATLGMAAQHQIPVTRNGERVFDGISHLTMDFGTVVRYGTRHLREQATAALQKWRGTESEAFERSCLACLDSMELWRSRYLELLRGQPDYAANYNSLSHVPVEPARNFHEAVQSLWFTFAFTRLTGHWPGIGRIDVILGDYLERDLADGVITMDEARELLAHFMIKGCEWICGGNYGSGDAQHYQNLVLSGTDENGHDVTNSVTWLILDILEETGISDFPTTVRLTPDSDPQLLRRCAEVMRHGGGTLAVYNEPLILRALKRFGYDEKEATHFANDGCWEVQIPGKTYFSYIPFDALRVLQQETLGGYAETVDYDSFDALYSRYLDDLWHVIDDVVQHMRKRFLPKSNKRAFPCTVASLFEGGCIESGRSYLDCGPTYNVISPHIGGFADVVDSLYAIRQLVFVEKRLTLREFLRILRDNWEGAEPLRQYVMNKYTYYGSDSDDADALAARLLGDFEDLCDRADQNAGCPYRFPAGVSTFGRQLEWAPRRLAVPHGYRAGTVLAGNCSPTPGTDHAGATAVIRSYCKLPLERAATGAALDIRLTPSSVSGEAGLDALISLMRGFVTLGGFFMQLDVADASVLRAAQEHPEDYQTLSVRVSGWNARFVTLNREWQDMVIGQMES